VARHQVVMGAWLRTTSGLQHPLSAEEPVSSENRHPELMGMHPGCHFHAIIGTSPPGLQHRPPSEVSLPAPVANVISLADPPRLHDRAAVTSVPPLAPPSRTSVMLPWAVAHRPLRLGLYQQVRTELD